MNEFFASFADSISALEATDNASLIFVDDAEYEFVSGGAAAVNSL